ncbi:MAG: preprotein translocase subunit SecA [Patescibacteria group bacterium]
MAFLGKIFGDTNKKELDKLQSLIDKINGQEKHFAGFSDDRLRQQTKEFQKRLKDNPKDVDIILPEAFAMVREAAKRTLKQRHYDVQLLGGIVLHQGKIAEMRTGEGKTLAATLPVYLNALTGKGVHVVTVNDYLARRDAVWMGQIYHLLGLSVSCIQHESAFLYDPKATKSEVNELALVDIDLDSLRPITRPEAYKVDITYGTNNEFGFDYLRDNMAPSLERQAQRLLAYAIVDEVDSILIDEARTPLIISSPTAEPTDKYYKFAQLVRQLQENQHFNIDEKMRAATFSDGGQDAIAKILNYDPWQENRWEDIHHLEQALRAETLFKRDKDYVAKDGEIIIIDEFTGRLMFGRRYSEGLHQAIEAKENVDIKQESITMATITFQNYFRMYQKLGGMTGTAATEAEEFSKIYDLDVVIIPTNEPMVRKDKPDKIYKTEEAKYQAVIEDIRSKHEIGQPILVGTISIDKNEYLGSLLTKAGIPHQILNAKQHEKEASIIAQAGKLGAVTVATNMAGRGVDIILGGNPPDYEEADQVKKKGGLAIIGTERHEARRIDNQLRGRSGRQGDAGVSQFYASLEDDLMRIFGSDRIKGIMNRLGVPDDMPIEHSMISRSIETAQKKVEGHNFDIRKHLVEYDDVINKHREVIYGRRQKILTMDDKSDRLKKEILDTVNKEIEQVVSFHTAVDDEKSWNLDEIYEVVDTVFPIDIKERIKLEDIREKAGDKMQDARSRTEIIQYLEQLAKIRYDQLEERIINNAPAQFDKGDSRIMRGIERSMLLRSIDTLWVEHIDMMDHLRTGIGLRGYGQADPLVEYKKEAYSLFTALLNNINKQVAYTIYKVGIAQETQNDQQKKMVYQAPAKNMTNTTKPAAFVAQDDTASAKDEARPDSIKEKAKDAAGKKVGRNDPCPCGSGKKYKKCCGK